MRFAPTAEQTAIVDAFQFGSDLVIEAGAGSGKTATLKLLAATTDDTGVYIAYNRSIAADAARAFPPSVKCKTAHGLAFAAIGRDYRHRLDAPRVPAQQVARILRINEPVQLAADLAPLAPQQLARIVNATIERFCYSADDTPGLQHVPFLAGLEAPQLRSELARAILPWAARAWEDLSSRTGELRFTHDTYLKLWALTRPQLGADYVLMDEAQDANPCVAALVAGQDAQRVWVGDACQAIYGWRGATDALSKADGTRLYLSKSFRFGPAVADEANKWLELLGAKLRITGHDPIPSTVGPVEQPDAVLCRTNAGAFSRAVTAIGAGHKTALVGGGADIKRMAQAAQRLLRGEPCDHPELLAFSSWSEVREYVQHDSGGDLKVFVDLIDTQGPEAVIALVDELVDERYADTVISTAHKAKGREWDRIHIAGDFREPKDTDTGRPGAVPREDAMLAYVSVTRAKLQLDRAGLSWVDRHLDPVITALRRHAANQAKQAARLAAALNPTPDPIAIASPPAPVEAVTHDPCPGCGYLPDIDGICRGCNPEVEPYPVGAEVHYRNSSTLTVFTVAAARASLGAGWVYDLKEPWGGRQGGVAGDLLQLAPQVVAHAAV